MKHVHYDKVVAKAANMDLVVFSYCNLHIVWSEDVPSQPSVEFIDSSNTDYFLCLPQNKEACLHWLNGGEVQYRPKKKTSSEFEYYWDQMPDCEDFEWRLGCIWMCDLDDIRIKPKKVKRWIVYKSDNVYGAYLSPEHIGDKLKQNGQLIEIEVEV